MDKHDPTQKRNHLSPTSVIAPTVFSIPIMYEDGCIERDRDKYQRIQELQKSYEELQEKIKEVFAKHQLQCERTKFAILQSNETVNRFFKKKTERA
ncbi:hypothetical protein EXU57_05605 [Segetibacter sp. 3557_3]|uniref:hypothetical protein n=1 Tax=Segetibacter sp. 3557_3 TaxID=2547429 RepID=UPI00105889E6|nr:hypothetical protein [Segetibacter sp. 3557_3]TDH27941.1 hypothetical protein EXU57_05605 [Segetibacter sp. 3557_3]